MEDALAHAKGARQVLEPAHQSGALWTQRKRSRSATKASRGAITPASLSQAMLGNPRAKLQITPSDDLANYLEGTCAKLSGGHHCHLQ